MRESELEKRFCQLVKQAGGKAYKFVSPGNAGVPDRIVVLPGARIGFVELKRQGGQLRELQRFKRAELENLGCYTAVVDSEERAAEIISEIGRMPATLVGDKLFAEMVSRTSVRGRAIL